MTYERFIEMHRAILTDYWNRIAPRLMEWKTSYEWPRGVYLADSISRRNQLEANLKTNLHSIGSISKQVFDDVMIWGFGRASNNSEDEIRKATKEAFSYLSQKQLTAAALSLTKLTGIGISRASKILALSNQNDLAIYDSRAAHGLSDLLYSEHNLIPIPPGRVIKGDPRPLAEFCSAFEKYVWVLTFLRECSLSDNRLSEHFRRVSDLEIAFFTKSRKEIGQPKNYTPPNHINAGVASDEGDCYWTLGHGKKAKLFWAHISEGGIAVLTGLDWKTSLSLANQDIELCLASFKDIGWFPLGNTIDAVKPNGLGEYFRESLKVSPKFASHFAAILVNQRRLEYRYGEHKSIELKVL